MNPSVKDEFLAKLNEQCKTENFGLRKYGNWRFSWNKSKPYYIVTTVYNFQLMLIACLLNKEKNK